jgi:hypothetical protein
MPRLRPPYPAESGLWGKPTLINNVETYSLVSWIISNGADNFASLGVGKSKGTKVFALAGKVDTNSVVVSFNDNINMSSTGIIIKVINAVLENEYIRFPFIAFIYCLVMFTSGEITYKQKPRGDSPWNYADSMFVGMASQQKNLLIFK